MQQPSNTADPAKNDSTGITVKGLEPGDESRWDAYVNKHPRGTLYHLSGWRRVIEKTYNRRSYYFLATKEQFDSNQRKDSIVGILPLVHMKHFLFGNTLVSMPYFDLGGVLADDEQTANCLLEKAVDLARDLKASNVELRHTQWLESQDGGGTPDETGPGLSPDIDLPLVDSSTGSQKVRMVMALPESADLLMKSFKAKLRSQIKKPLKEGLSSKIGGPELLDDFYHVFSQNMRDLGSPVHSRHLAENTLDVFSDTANIVVVYKGTEPVACSLIIGFKDILENPWASALRKYSGLSPNMLLYWTMLEHACNEGFTHFDFGRSTPDMGTYKFKKQWGAEPVPLQWHYISVNGHAGAASTEQSQYAKMIQIWKKLPVPVTRIIGPMIRKHIGL